jgi:putative transposase
VSRSNWCDAPAPETAENLRLMQRIDQEYTAHPFLGSRGMTAWLIEQGEEVNRKRVPRLMGVEAIYPKPKLSAGARTCTCGDAKRCPRCSKQARAATRARVTARMVGERVAMDGLLWSRQWGSLE